MARRDYIDALEGWNEEFKGLGDYGQKQQGKAEEEVKEEAKEEAKEEVIGEPMPKIGLPIKDDREQENPQTDLPKEDSPEAELPKASFPDTISPEAELGQTTFPKPSLGYSETGEAASSETIFPKPPLPQNALPEVSSPEPTSPKAGCGEQAFALTEVKPISFGEAKLASRWFKTANEVDDVLMPTLTSHLDQCVYRRLYRLSYGFGSNYAQVSQKALVEAVRCSDPGLRASIARLEGLGYIEKLNVPAKLEATAYRVYLPHEIEALKDKATDRNTETYPQHTYAEVGLSEIDFPEIASPKDDSPKDDSPKDSFPKPSFPKDDLPKASLGHTPKTTFPKPSLGNPTEPAQAGFDEYPKLSFPKAGLGTKEGTKTEYKDSRSSTGNVDEEAEREPRSEPDWQKQVKLIHSLLLPLGFRINDNKIRQWAKRADLTLERIELCAKWAIHKKGTAQLGTGLFISAVENEKDYPDIEPDMRSPEGSGKGNGEAYSSPSTVDLEAEKDRVVTDYLKGLDDGEKAKFDAEVTARLKSDLVYSRAQSDIVKQSAAKSMVKRLALEKVEEKRVKMEVAAMKDESEDENDDEG